MSASVAVMRDRGYSGMMHESDQTPFQVFMSAFWNEAGDLYLGSFENALHAFLRCATEDHKRQFAQELEEVGRGGLIGDIDSPQGIEFWNSLGGRALGKDEYMLALRTVSRWSD